MGTQANPSGLFTTWTLLQQAYGLLYKNLDRRMTTLGISQAQAAVLLVLQSVDAPLPMSRLARLLVQEAQSVTSLVDRLELQGLVRRVPSSTDRRVIFIALTPAGETRFREVGLAMAEGLEDIFSALSARELESFSTSLRQLRNRGSDTLRLSRHVFEEAERDGSFAPHPSQEVAPVP